jgi:hypothetical protein
VASTVIARAPAWADGIAVSGAEMRAAIEGTKWASAGIVRGLAVSQIPTPAMQIRVTAGLSVVADGQNGFLPLELAAQTDLDVGASSPTLPRIDSLIAEFVDNGASSLYRYRIVAGTAAASPVQPPLPYADQPTGKTLRIANIAVAANATTIVNANITMQATAAVPANYGRVPTVSSDGGRPAGPTASDRIWRSDKTCSEVWDGTAWREEYVAGTGPAWTSYTPAMTASTTNPNIGSTGTAQGRYMQIGKLVHFYATITPGGTGIAGGSGGYAISLPVTARTTVTQRGSIYLFDSSAGLAFHGTFSIGSTTIALAVQGTGQNESLVSGTAPFSISSGDTYHAFATYEAA